MINTNGKCHNFETFLQAAVDYRKVHFLAEKPFDYKLGTGKKAFNHEGSSTVPTKLWKVKLITFDGISCEAAKDIEQCVFLFLSPH